MVGGQFAGGALRRGVRSRLAFAIAFLIGLPIPLVVVSGLEALSGREGFTELGLGFVPGFVIAYGLLGAVGSALDGDGWRRTVRASGAFAGGGLCGGVMLAGVVTLAAGSSGGVLVAHTVGAAVACILPTAIGGWWLGWQVSAPGGR